MKKLVAIALSLLIALSMAACGGAPAAPEPAAPPAAPEPAAPANPEPAAPADPEPAVPADEGVTLENIKIGFVHVSDPSDMGYTYNHDRGTQEMQEALGISDNQIINKFNVAEDSSCESALKELIDEGCNIIFGTSFGFENYMLEAAAQHPEIEFCHATGYQAAGSGLPNMHNYFGSIYEARYLTGIVAGLKTQTNKLGYVTAMPFAECISGFTGFYLGAKSVNPDVTMDVMFTNSWNDPTNESRVAQALIDLGCDVLGQHCDSPNPMTTAEANGVWGVGYNSDMRGPAPKAAMVSAIWDWGKYLITAVQLYVDGQPIPVDSAGGLAEGVVLLSPFNDDILPEGAKEAVQKAHDAILSGELYVFTGPLHGVDLNTGEEYTLADGDKFIEPQSAPSWSVILDGITVHQ